MKPPILACLLMSAGWTATAAAEPGDVGFATRLQPTLNPTGFVRFDYFRSSKELDVRTDFIGTTAQLKVLPVLGALVDGKVEARVTNPEATEGGSTRGTLLEAFATLHFPKADLRLGRQIIAWGRADGINPTDNLSPRDFVVLLPFEDDQRFGTTGGKLDVYLSSQHTLSVFTSAWFEPAKVPLPTSAVPFEQRAPGHSFRTAEFAVKLDQVGAGFDWSLSFFHGYSPLPSLSLTAPTSSRPVIQLAYDRVNMIGADFARNFGRFGLRGEIAYMDTADRSGADFRRRNPNLFLVVGVDRTLGDNLNVNLQYFHRAVRHHHSPTMVADPGERAVALQHAILNSERDATSDGVTLRVSNKWFNDTLEAEIFGVINRRSRDGFVRPSVTYAFTDHWKATVGGDLFRGALDTQYGILKANRGAFAEFRFGF